MARHLAAYDISEDKTRTKVAAVLSEFGYRLQWSVCSYERCARRRNPGST